MTTPLEDTATCTTCGHTVTDLGGLWATLSHVCPCGSPGCPYGLVPALTLLAQLEGYSEGGMLSFVMTFSGDFESSANGPFDRQIIKHLASIRSGIVTFDPAVNGYLFVAVMPKARDH